MSRPSQPSGISGVIAACRFPQHILNLDFVIYEKNSDLGGTWFENKCVFQGLHEKSQNGY